MFNGAKGGTTSMYTAMCVHEHVQNDTDIVFVEFASNDHPRSWDWPLDHYER